MLWHDKYMLRKKKSQYKKMKMYKNCTHIAIFFNLFPLIYYDMGKKVQKVRLARVVGIKKRTQPLLPAHNQKLRTAATA